MRKILILAAGLLFAAPALYATPAAPAQTDEKAKVQEAGEVMKDILNIPDDIPRNVLDKARCVIVLPSVKKGAFIVGGEVGHGAMVCRTGSEYNGAWGAPAMYVLEGGSVGYQIGGEATDLVLLVMNDHGVNSLLHSKVKLGADASAAAGPKGRSAAADTDAALRSEILTYSRSRGAFAGVSLEGASLRPDNKANENLYGQPETAQQIIAQKTVPPPAEANLLDSTLQNASPRLKS
jgi:lipid-binding SYLF domain-containing protein